MTWMLLGIGFLGGALGALLGIGGGVVIVPALTLVAGLGLREAVGASLVAVVATSVASSTVYLRKRLVEVGLGIELQFTSVVGAVAAGLIAAWIPERPVTLAFAGLVGVTAVSIWPRRVAVSDPPTWGSGARRRVTWAAGLGAGGISGMLGVGGGILYTPLLHLVHRLPFNRAAATSVYVIGVSAAAGAAVYLVRGDVAVGVAATGAVGALAGSSLVATVGHRVSQRTLLRVFAVLMVYISIVMATRALVG